MLSSICLIRRLTTFPYSQRCRQGSEAGILYAKPGTREGDLSSPREKCSLQQARSRRAALFHVQVQEQGCTRCGDISPWLQARGFLSSLRGFPASLRLASFGFHRTWSYSLSTGSNREPRGQNVLCRIEIPIMDDATLRARPATNIKR